MKRELAHIFKEVINDDLSEDCEFRDENYSGRCMYGEKTSAICVDNISIFMTAIPFVMATFINREDEPDVDEVAQELTYELQSLRTDGMGKGIVIY